MGRLVIPGVECINGRLYFRRRWRDENGKRKAHRIPLPSADSPDFADALAAARGPDTVVRTAPAAGTIAALCHAFRSELPTRRTKRGPLSPRTIENQRRYADRIEREHGHRMIAQMQPFHVYRIQAGMAEEPGVANNYISVLRNMYGLACRMGWAKSNPASGVPALPIGEWEPWPERVIEAALAVAQPMTRLAIVTYLCSGQRGGDIIRMQHGWHDRRIMHVRQDKTDKAVAVPMHPLWLTEIDRLPRRAVTLLYDRSGKPFNDLATLRERIMDCLKRPSVRAALVDAVAAGEIPAGAPLVPHGLKKNASVYLYELGLTEEEIGGITGNSPELVRHYTKRARVNATVERIADRVAGANVLPMPGLKGIAGNV